jgi:flagellar basal body rod protein FlgG
VKIGGEGQVVQGLEPIGRLRIVDFADPSQLARDGSGYWHASGRLERTAHTAMVHQGHLEESNVNAMEELVELIVVQRAYESASNVVRSIDRSYRSLYQS